MRTVEHDHYSKMISELLRRLDGLVQWNLGLSPFSQELLQGLLQVPPNGIRSWASFRFSERMCVAETVAASLRPDSAPKAEFLVAAE